MFIFCLFFSAKLWEVFDYNLFYFLIPLPLWGGWLTVHLLPEFDDYRFCFVFVVIYLGGYYIFGFDVIFEFRF